VDVLDQTVLDLLLVVKREDFVPPQYRALAFSDMEIRCASMGWIPASQCGAKDGGADPAEVAIKGHETVLEIGTGSGYFAALLAHKAQQVVSIEIDPRLHAFASGNLGRAGVHNARLECGDGSRAGRDEVRTTSSSSPAPCPSCRSAAHATEDRRPARCGRWRRPVMSAELITRVADTSFDTIKLFEPASSRCAMPSGRRLSLLMKSVSHLNCPTGSPTKDVSRPSCWMSANRGNPDLPHRRFGTGADACAAGTAARAGSIRPDRLHLSPRWPQRPCHDISGAAGLRRRYNLTGGVDAWARQVDAAMPTY